VLLPDVEEGELPAQAERFLRAVHQLGFGGQPPRVTISIGYAALGEGETAAAWIARADRALYRAKASGRDRAVSAEAPSGPCAPFPASTAGATPREA
jgi:GGDEF domain-containing protein